MLTIEQYEAKRQARYERLLRAAQKAEQESDSSLSQARKMADFIPLGQPLLTDHHSYKRDRNYRDRIGNKYRKGFELMKRAEELKNRAESIASNDSIFSDDPQALNKLDDKLADLKAEQAEMKRINSALRKGADFDSLEMPEHLRKMLLDVEKYQAYYQPRKRGFPPYAMTSINTKIKTAEKRAELVETKQSIPDKDEEVNGIRIEWRAGENRIRLFYPSRVDRETFELLKKHGYRVLRSEGEGAFSAYYNHNATYFIQTFIRNK